MSVSIIDSSTNNHIQWMTLRVHVPKLNSDDVRTVLRTLQQVDPHANSSISLTGRDNSEMTFDLTVSLTLLLQDSSYMDTYRKTMFKLRLKCPNIYIEGGGGGSSTY